MSNKARSVNDGDWICGDSDCANINFSWRTKCNKCGKEKTKVEIFKKTGSEIGKKAAEKSGGLFSADDWHCSSCGNVNWARRTDCNVCNTAKFGTVEPRTGLGGGYNERGTVEYIEREESDDEYDQFGRRNKKHRGSTNEKEINSKEITTTVDDKTITTTVHYAEEADSGEEVDLSKYDLADEEEDDDEDTSKYDLGEADSPEVKSLSVSQPRGQTRAKSPKSSGRNYPSRSSRSRSHSSVRKRSRSRSRDVKRRSRYSRSRSRDRSRSPAKKRKSRGSRSRSHSRDRDPRNSRSRSRSRDRYARRSRSSSRDKTRDRRNHRRSYSRSRSRSRERRRGYKSRSRSRERYR